MQLASRGRFAGHSENRVELMAEKSRPVMHNCNGWDEVGWLRMQEDGRALWPHAAPGKHQAKWPMTTSGWGSRNLMGWTQR